MSGRSEDPVPTPGSQESLARDITAACRFPLSGVGSEDGNGRGGLSPVSPHSGPLLPRCSPRGCRGEDGRGAGNPLHPGPHPPVQELRGGEAGMGGWGVPESDFLPRWAAGAQGAKRWLPVEGERGGRPSVGPDLPGDGMEVTVSVSTCRAEASPAALRRVSPAAPVGAGVGRGTCRGGCWSLRDHRPSGRTRSQTSSEARGRRRWPCGERGGAGRGRLKQLCCPAGLPLPSEQGAREVSPPPLALTGEGAPCTGRFQDPRHLGSCPGKPHSWASGAPDTVRLNARPRSLPSPCRRPGGQPLPYDAAWPWGQSRASFCAKAPASPVAGVAGAQRPGRGDASAAGLSQQTSRSS